MNRGRAVCLTIAGLAMAVAPTEAQSVFSGRVLTDSGVVLAGAEIVLNGPQNPQRTNVNASTQNAPAKLAAPPRPGAQSRTGRPEPYCGILVIWLR